VSEQVLAKKLLEKSAFGIQIEVDPRRWIIFPQQLKYILTLKN
jgi:hypothetical protein